MKFYPMLYDEQGNEYKSEFYVEGEDWTEDIMEIMSNELLGYGEIFNLH